MTPRPPLRAVLLDVVGTLIFPDPAAAQVYWEVGRRYGSQLELAEVESRFRQAFAQHCDAGATNEARERLRWRDIVAQVFPDLPAAREAVFDELWRHFARAEHWSLFEEVPAAWKALEDAGLRVALASNFDERLGAICRRLAPLNRAEHVFYSSAVGFPKPRREFFEAIEQQLGLPATSLVLIGNDPINDLQGPLAAGWHAILLDRKSGKGLMQAIGPLLDRSKASDGTT